MGPFLGGRAEGLTNSDWFKPQEVQSLTLHLGRTWKLLPTRVPHPVKYKTTGIKTYQAVGALQPITDARKNKSGKHTNKLDLPRTNRDLSAYRNPGVACRISTGIPQIASYVECCGRTRTERKAGTATQKANFLNCTFG